MALSWRILDHLLWPLVRRVVVVKGRVVRQKAHIVGEDRVRGVRARKREAIVVDEGVGRL